MIFVWIKFFCWCIFVQYTCSITQPEYVLHLKSSRNKQIKSLSTSINNDEYSLHMNQTNKYGLVKCAQQYNQCYQIAIIGAGVSGLYTAILLAQSGHNVTIYEANDRAGGRIFTYRDEKNSSLYMGELGAMRFPLDAHPYLNNLIRERYRLTVEEFISSSDNGYAYINGIWTRVKEAQDNPDIFGFRTNLNERGKNAEKLWSDAIKPIIETFHQQGWLNVLKQWDSYSIHSYLNKMNVSNAAIDYIGLFTNIETNLYSSILEAVRDELILNDRTKFYYIQNGNDLLIQSMINECNAIESNRCSIVYSTPIIRILLNTSNHIQVTTKNHTHAIFHSAFVATTSTTAQLIDFDPRINFIDKYRGLRQLHYDCASKILLFFNTSWWITQENIINGRSITDLPIRFIYYPSNNITYGGTILASYTWSQDSIVWQSLTDSDAIELALKNLIEIHRNSSNLRNYFQGGIVKHWCNDPYFHGSFALFTPFQETEIVDELQQSNSNLYFIGEYTSSAHGWVEGAILSSLRGILDFQKQQQQQYAYDVVIIGGGPIGLMTSIFLSIKQPTLRIAIIEKGDFFNSDGSSGSFDRRQFRQMYNEEYLAELTNISLSLYRQIEQMTNISLGSIANIDDGYLFVGDYNLTETTVEGDLTSIKQTCEKLHMNCEYLNNTQLKERYPIFTLSNQYQGIYHNQSGYINVTMLRKSLLQILQLYPNIIRRNYEEFLSLKFISPNQTEIYTDRGILYASKKILFTPGPYAKNLSNLLNFDLNITLWEMPTYYFRLLPNATRFPTWFVWGGNDLQTLFYGFSPSNELSNYIMIAPNFIRNMTNPLLYPNQRTNFIDPFLTEKVIEWVSKNMAKQVNISDYKINNRTCLASFFPDNGFLIDYVPNTNNRVIFQAAGWGMKFIPVWGDILSDMILLNNLTTESSKYSKYMKYFSLSRPYRLIENNKISSVNNTSTNIQFSLKFIFIDRSLFDVIRIYKSKLFPKDQLFFRKKFIILNYFKDYKGKKY